MSLSYRFLIKLRPNRHYTTRSFIWQNKRSDTRLSIKHLHATELFSQMDLYKPWYIRMQINYLYIFFLFSFFFYCDVCDAYHRWTPEQIPGIIKGFLTVCFLSHAKTITCFYIFGFTEQLDSAGKRDFINKNEIKWKNKSSHELSKGSLTGLKF